MPSFSERSIDRLDTCHQDLIKVFVEVIKHVDCTILEGERSFEQQLEYFRTGKSKLDPTNPDLLARAKHVKTPSQAVDVAPYPIDWEDRERFSFFAGFVLATGKSLGVNLRSGVNWDSDLTTLDSTGGWMDAPHYELVD